VAAGNHGVSTEVGAVREEAKYHQSPAGSPADTIFPLRAIVN